MPKELLPYLVPLLIAAVIIRRSGRARKVNLGRIWVGPVIFGLMTFGALASAPSPGPLVAAAFVVAAATGAGVGYLRAHHLHLSVDPETGEISSRATMVGTLLVLGLFAVRFGMKLAFPQLADHSHASIEVAQIANGLLIFTVAMLIAQSVLIWSRTQPLLAAHAARTAFSPPD